MNWQIWSVIISFWLRFSFVLYVRGWSSPSNFIYISVEKGKGKLKVKNQYLIEQNMYFENYIQYSLFQYGERVQHSLLLLSSIRSRSFINGKSVRPTFYSFSNFVSTNVKVSIRLSLIISLSFFFISLSSFSFLFYLSLFHFFTFSFVHNIIWKSDSQLFF